MKIDGSYGGCGILPQKIAGTFYEKGSGIELYCSLGLKSVQAGNCLFCCRELRITVTDYS